MFTFHTYIYPSTLTFVSGSETSTKMKAITDDPINIYMYPAIPKSESMTTVVICAVEAENTQYIPVEMATFSPT